MSGCSTGFLPQSFLLINLILSFLEILQMFGRRHKQAFGWPHLHQVWRTHWCPPWHYKRLTFRDFRRKWSAVVKNCNSRWGVQIIFRTTLAKWISKEMMKSKNNGKSMVQTGKVQNGSKLPCVCSNNIKTFLAITQQLEIIAQLVGFSGETQQGR